MDKITILLIVIGMPTTLIALGYFFRRSRKKDIVTKADRPWTLSHVCQWAKITYRYHGNKTASDLATFLVGRGFRLEKIGEDNFQVHMIPNSQSKKAH